MSRLRAWLGARLADSSADGGSISPMVPIVVLALFILGGLVVDGSRDLNARGEAQAYAEEAARAGATAIDPTSGVDLALDTTVAQQRVSDYCAAIRAAQPGLVQECGLDTSTGVAPNLGFTSTSQTCDKRPALIVVNTVVQLRIQTSLLGIVGVSDLTSSGQAKARPFQGTSAANAC